MVTRQFVICYSQDGEERKSRKHSRGFFPSEKIINAFIDSIKMKDYCIAARSLAFVCFAHVPEKKGKEQLQKKWKIMYDDSICKITTRYRK